jgi:hypothetical protein
VEAWWCDTLKAQLSQGDILQKVPFWSIRSPIGYLEKRTQKENRVVWVEVVEPSTDGHGNVHVLTRARVAYGLVLNHDCDLDKEKRQRRVQLAMLADLDGLNKDEREKVLESRVYHRFVLPDVPQLGKTLYADLRAIVTVDRELADGCDRIASLSEEGAERLRAQIVAFFTRLDLQS